MAPPICIGEHSALDSDTCASRSTGIDRTAASLRAAGRVAAVWRPQRIQSPTIPVRSRTDRWRSIETTEWSSEATSRQTRPPPTPRRLASAEGTTELSTAIRAPTGHARVASSRLGFPDQISRSTPANWRLEQSHRHSTKKCPDEGFCRSGTSGLCGRKLQR